MIKWTQQNMLLLVQGY